MLHQKPVDPLLINQSDWTKTMKAIKERIRACLSKTKIPLAYIVQEDIGIPVGPDPSANYTLIQDEMIRRAPCTTPPDPGTQYITGEPGTGSDLPDGQWKSLASSLRSVSWLCVMTRIVGPTSKHFRGVTTVEEHIVVFGTPIMSTTWLLLPNPNWRNHNTMEKSVDIHLKTTYLNNISYII